MTRILLLLFFLSSTLQAQHRYRLTFRDKGPEAATFRTRPEAILSERSLQRRAAHNVPFRTADLPVSTSYLQQLRQAGAAVEQHSKWLNSVIITSAHSPEELLQRHSFITNVKALPARVQPSAKAEEKLITKSASPQARQPLDYGFASPQVQQLNLECLHNQGFTGKGVLIAQFDAGWNGMDTLQAYDSLRQQGRLLATRNFVDPAQDVYRFSDHGEITLSTMAANIPGTFVGTAPHAAYALALTEIAWVEVNLEELHWAAAAEWADSLGADIISSSLGYRTFDSAQVSYSLADLNGDIATVTRAADHAAAVGILVVNSAGNSGQTGISAACDGDSVLCVGAVDINNQVAGFSSVGPTGDGRIKPDVVALGAPTPSILTNGQIAVVNGTSLSCPVVAGFAASLKSAHPAASNMELYAAIKGSGDFASAPDNSHGWGLPHGCRADSLLSSLLDTAQPLTASPFAIPNLTDDVITLSAVEGSIQTVIVYNALGTLMLEQKWPAKGNHMTLSLQTLRPGFYIVRGIKEGRKIRTARVVKR